MLSWVLLAFLHQAEPDPLVEAQALVVELRFTDAISKLQLLRRTPGLSLERRNHALELLATCHVAEGHRDDAEGAYIDLLRETPEYEPDSNVVSPKVIEVFSSAKRKLYPDGYVAFVEQATPVGWVRLRLIDPWHIVNDVRRFERLNGGTWQELPMKPTTGNRYEFETPARVGQKLEWYVQAINLAQDIVTHVATAEAPRSVGVLDARPVAPKPDSAVRKGIGTGLAVVAGVAAATAIGLQVASSERYAAARDRTKFPGDWADTARQADDLSKSLGVGAAAVAIGAGVLGATGVALIIF